MHEVSNTEEDSIENFYKKIYKERFGIRYQSRSTKRLSISSNDCNLKISFIKSIQKKRNSNNNKSSPSNNLESFYKNKSIINDEELDKIYNFDYNIKEIPPIYNFLKMEKWSEINSGIKKSTEDIQYSYCKTCDHNLVKPICLDCINIYHKGHLIKYIINKGKIIYSCLEKNHHKENNYECLCN